MGSTRPQTGTLAPPIRAQAVGGSIGPAREISLEEFRGRPLVVYFYPKDATPGCTIQACALRDGWDELKERAIVFGVSADTIASHAKFQAKRSLPFALISDPDKSIASAYGVWVQKSFLGRKFMGIERSTFVIDADGILAAVIEKVSPTRHLSLVHAALDALR